MILLPRLGTEKSTQRLDILCSGSDKETIFSESLAREFFHDDKAFPVTGGNPIDFDTLLEFRRESHSIFASLPHKGQTNDFSSAFDLAFGQLLFQAFPDSTSELGVPEVWDYLTLLLLPDFAQARFPATDRGAKFRYQGGHRRHVFQRLWKRWKVLGGEIVLSGQLTEDDYQAILERKFFLERPEISRIVASKIIESPLTGDRRRKHTRLFLRQLTQLSALVVFDPADSDHLNQMLNEMHDLALASFGYPT